MASPTAAGQRLDRFVCAQLPALGRAAARRLIEAGDVRVNGRRAAAGQRVQAGDTVELQADIESTAAQPDPAVELAVVYEDAQLVVVDKPAGMPSHPLRPGERGTLASGLVARYPQLAGVGYSPREPGLLHRLDTDTSGLVLAARDAETWRALRGELERGAIDKRYLALCSGAVRAPAVHEAWLSPRGARVQVRSAPFASAVPVSTEILVSEPAGAFSLLTVRAHVARRHQIRAHLAALGHPIAGDVTYGGCALPGLTRHFLHASALHFIHPHTGEPVHVEAPLPADLRAAIAAAQASSGSEHS